MNKKLQKQIEKKLDKLTNLLGEITEANIINPDDPDTWDVDTLYDLAEQLKKALKLLEGQKSKKLDDFGDPIVLKEGLLDLIDTCQEDQDEEEDYD